MGRLREMEIFVRVVEGGSFSAAAAFEFVAVYSQKAMPVTISDEVQEVLAAAYISGPLLDCIDLHIEVPLVKFREMMGAKPGETSTQIRERVIQVFISVGFGRVLLRCASKVLHLVPPTSYPIPDGFRTPGRPRAGIGEGIVAGGIKSASFLFHKYQTR